MFTLAADTRKLTERTQVWARTAGVSMIEGLRRQAGLLKQDLWRDAPPKNLKRSKLQAEKDVGRVFRAGPKVMFDAKKRAGNGMVWLYAGKKNGRFLAGVEPSDFQPGLSVEGMRKVMKGFKGISRAPKWERIGKRGKKDAFNIMKLRRVIVQPSRLLALTKKVMDSFGKQKAAWAVGIEKFGGKRPPQWIAKHIATARGENVLHLTGDRPFIRIISRARGVETEASKKVISRAIKKRMASMKTDMKLYLNGTKKKAGLN